MFQLLLVGEKWSRNSMRLVDDVIMIHKKRNLSKGIGRKVVDYTGVGVRNDWKKSKIEGKGEQGTPSERSEAEDVEQNREQPSRKSE